MRSRTLIAALVLSTLAASAYGQTAAQRMKAWGHTPEIPLADVGKVALAEARLEVLDERDIHCGHPDFYDPEIAAVSVEDLTVTLGLSAVEAEALITCHRRLTPGMEAVGSGSFPAGCLAPLFLDQ